MPQKGMFDTYISTNQQNITIAPTRGSELGKRQTMEQQSSAKRAKATVINDTDERIEAKKVTSIIYDVYVKYSSTFSIYVDAYTYNMFICRPCLTFTAY
jgi:hypothetical protein